MAYKFSKLDVSSQKTFLPAELIYISAATKHAIRSNSFLANEKLSLRKSCLEILASIVTMVQKRNPLKYSRDRSANSLYPIVISGEPEV